jgi:hypothetical protein
MKRNSVKVDVEVDTTELKDAITLIRRLKYEVVELRKQGLSRRVINKIILKTSRKIAKSIKDKK